MNQRTRKPNFKTINAILEKKALAYQMLEEVEKEITGMIEKYGEVRFDYDLKDELEGPDGQQYCKIVLSDNVRKINDGEELYSHTRFKRVDADIQFLKRIPESLK